MTIAMLRSRYLLAMPRSSSLHFLGAPSAYDQGDLSFPVECVSAGLSFLQHFAPSGVCWIPGQGGAQYLIQCASGWQDVDRCFGGWARLWKLWFGCAASVRMSGVARVRSRANCYAFPGRRERWAAPEASSFSRTLEAGWLVPGGTGRLPAAASRSILPGSAWEGD